jgi:hypothetical protein
LKGFYFIDKNGFFIYEKKVVNLTMDHDPEWFNAAGEIIESPSPLDISFEDP